MSLGAFGISFWYPKLNQYFGRRNSGMKNNFGYLLYSILLIVTVVANNALAEEPATPKRPFFEYKGNYADQLNALKDKFRQQYGYELVDMGKTWSPDDVKNMHTAFSYLPETFFHLPGLKALYRLDHFQTDRKDFAVGEIPAAALPGFLTYYEVESRSYKARLNNQDPRVEFYNGLFYEDDENFNNIVHHEMAHIVDMLNGFYSFSKEWISITEFQMVHLPARDTEAGSDFRFQLLDNPNKDNYAPVSTRHLSTYSRQNIQEDFANSAAAYIQYPYFQYSHPKRYQFLKTRIFGGKEYFSPSPSLFKDKVIADYRNAFVKMDWDKVRHIMIELSRNQFLEIESALVLEMNKTFSTDPVKKRDLELGKASCYLSDPGALEFRKNLLRKKRVIVEELLKNSRCVQVGRDNFEENMATWAPGNIILFINTDELFLQFLDPVQQVAYSRGFHSRYIWRILLEGKNEPLREGKFILDKGSNGSVRIDLGKVQATPLPVGLPLTLELGIQRHHPKTFKSINSKPTQTPIIVHSDFNYIGPESPTIRVIYPFRKAYKQFN
jgi:hypothetical protein